MKINPSTHWIWGWVAHKVGMGMMVVRTKILTLPGMKPVVQPVVSHFSDSYVGFQQQEVLYITFLTVKHSNRK